MSKQIITTKQELKEIILNANKNMEEKIKRKQKNIKIKIEKNILQLNKQNDMLSL